MLACSHPSASLPSAQLCWLYFIRALKNIINWQQYTTNWFGLGHKRLQSLCCCHSALRGTWRVATANILHVALPSSDSDTSATGIQQKAQNMAPATSLSSEHPKFCFWTSRYSTAYGIRVKTQDQKPSKRWPCQPPKANNQVWPISFKLIDSKQNEHEKKLRKLICHQTLTFLISKPRTSPPPRQPTSTAFHRGCQIQAK